MLYSTRRVNRVSEFLRGSTHIRCASCGVGAQTTRRIQKTEWSFGAEHLNRNPQSLLSHRVSPQLTSQWSTVLVNILLLSLWNEGSPDARWPWSGGLAETCKSEQLISINVLRLLRFGRRLQVFAVCRASFGDKGGISSSSRQAVAAPAESFMGSLIKHQIWWSINSPSADWRSVGKHFQTPA